MNKFLLYILPVVLFACGDPEPVSDKADAGSVSDTILLSQAQQDASGLQTAVVLLEKISSTVRCNGVIDVPPQYLADLNPPLPGYLVDILVKGGESVRKGQVLAILEHPDYVELQRRYLETRSQLVYAEKDFKRQQSLYKDEATAAKSFEKAEADLKMQQAAAASLAAQLKRLGIDADKLTPDKLSATVQLKAPFSGFVVRVDGAIGRYVGSDRPVIQLVNKEHLHIELEVFEQDLESIKIGQHIRFTVLNAGSRTYTGDVFLIGPTIDLEKRTTNIHGHVDGHHDFLRPGMFVQAVIESAPVETTTVPEGALIRSGEQFFVFRELSKGRYLRLAVEPGVTNQGRTAIRQGLATGDRIATIGVQFLEASYQQAFETE